VTRRHGDTETGRHGDASPRLPFRFLSALSANSAVIVVLADCDEALAVAAAEELHGVAA
jgi:hypothetical protein